VRPTVPHGLAVFVLALLCLPIAVSAEVRVWDAGAGTTDWFAPANWDPNGTPDPADALSVLTGMPATTADVVASDGGSIVFDGPAAGASLRDLYAGKAGDGVVRILGGAAVTGDWGLIGRDLDSNGVVVVDGNAPGGTGSRWANTGRIHVGHYGTGRLEVARGADVTCSEGRVGWEEDANGTVVLDGAGSTWSVATNLVVGDWGLGRMTVRGGAAASSRDGYVGSGGAGVAPQRGDGTVTVTGDGSLWACSRSLSVAQRSEGVLNVLAGGKVVTRDVAYVGEESDGNGTVTVRGVGLDAPSTWECQNFTYVGWKANGRLEVLDGGQVFSAGADIAYDTGVLGAVLVDGNGSTWTNAGPLYVGDWGVGSLTVRDGGAVSNQTCYVASGEHADGTVLVEGAGATWASTSDLYVCHQGTGRLTVRDGGAVLNATGLVGYHLDGNGTAAVDGAGSTWTSLGPLYVAHSGSGSLSVTNGGLAVSQTGHVGYNGSATGTVVVAGKAAAWRCEGELRVGERGLGSLAVRGGGAVSDTVGYVAFHPGSRGVVTVDGEGSAWKSTGDLYVGREGDGSLTVTGGGRATTSLCHIGDRADGNGVVAVSGTAPGGAPSTLDSSGQMFVGWQGRARLAVSGGGRVYCASGEVGAHPSSVGEVLVEGTAPNSAPSELWYDSYLFVGTQGTGRLTVRDGGMLSNELGVIGRETGSDGNAIVEGGGALWENVGDLHVGQDGTGRLAVRDGGAVVCSTAFIASAAGSDSSAVVEGAGSTWAALGALSVGDRGTGTLDVRDGGVVTSGTGFLGAEGSADGRATVDGAGSAWHVADAMYVGGDEFGAGGPGLLDVRGGSVSVGGTLRVRREGEVVLRGGSLDANAVVLDGGAAFVFTGGRLSAATFDGDLTNAGGAACPGRGRGVMTVTGDYVQQAAGLLEIELGDGSAMGPYDRLAVGGTAELAGTLALICPGEPAYGETFEVLSAASCSGAFDKVTVTVGSPDIGLVVWQEPDAVLVLVAVPGDADLDGQVTAADLAAVEAGLALIEPTWADGDFNHDRTVDHIDYLAWKAHAGWTAESGPPAPEPTALVLLALLAPTALLRRRRPTP